MLALTLTLLASATPGRVFVTPAQAADMIGDGAITIDARLSSSAPYLPNARTLSWFMLRDGLGRTGRLAETAKLEEALREIGVEADQPVLVYGEADRGWGEEARIWWTLAYLGHRNVRILDGGIQAWRAAGLRTWDDVADAKEGSFRARVEKKLRADHQRVLAAVRGHDAQVLDARTQEEYDGATPYFSYRGGHVPGARRLEWRQLLDDRGRVLPRERLERLFTKFGLSRKKPVIAYCTGGVRSAFVIAALVEAGFEDTMNYDGSWWDWASRTELPISRMPAPRVAPR